MANSMTLEQLEQHVMQLPPQEQLKLVAYISARLSALPLSMPPVKSEGAPQQLGEADSLLAFCDEAAEMWEGSFDSAEDVRQMRRERDVST